MKKTSDPYEALREYFVELYEHDNATRARRAFRRLMWLMVKQRLLPGDLEMSEEEFQFHAKQVQIPYPKMFESFKEVFERLHGT